jgi:hypothetical protein
MYLPNVDNRLTGVSMVFLGIKFGFMALICVPDVATIGLSMMYVLFPVEINPALDWRKPTY